MPERDPSTSSKEARTAIATFVIAVVVLGIGLELFGRFGVVRASRVEARIQGAMSHAERTLTSPAREGVTRILVLGNSIANDGVDLALLERELEPRAIVVSGIVEDTTWLDWRYFLSRVGRGNWRPELVLFVCRPMHFAMTNTRGRYGASRLYGFADIPEIASRTGRDATRTSELMFARLSAFYGFRTELTKIALTTGIPIRGIRRAFRAPTAGSPSMPSFSSIRGESRGTRTIAAAMGAKIDRDPAGAHNSASASRPSRSRARRRFAYPSIADDAWPIEKFADGFHLGAEGASPSPRRSRRRCPTRCSSPHCRHLLELGAAPSPVGVRRKNEQRAKGRDDKHVRRSTVDLPGFVACASTAGSIRGTRAMPHDVNWSIDGRWRTAPPRRSNETVETTSNARSASGARDPVDRFEGLDRRVGSRDVASNDNLFESVTRAFSGMEASPGALGGCRTRRSVTRRAPSRRSRRRSRLGRMSFLGVPGLGGRDNKTDGSAQARAYIERQFRKSVSNRTSAIATRRTLLADGTSTGPMLRASFARIADEQRVHHDPRAL